MRVVLIFIVLSLFGISCNNSEKTDSREVPKNQLKEKQVAASVPPAIMDKGKDIYNKHCMACHQTDGSGNPGMYPPLSETRTVNGDKQKLISILLNGQTGEIEVKGEIYNGVMVPHNFLTDQQAADVLTYIRNSFGNNAGRITEEDIAAVRSMK